MISSKRHFQNMMLLFLVGQSQHMPKLTKKMQRKRTRNNSSEDHCKLDRMRKGKARVRPEAENHQPERPLGLLGSSVPPDRLNRPLIRHVCLEPKGEPTTT